jgi:hypothetical protein
MDNLKPETIKRPVDECSCDWCATPLLVRNTVFIDLNHGTAYCSRACAEQDASDHGYGSAYEAA